ncbi:hypothetical protein KUW09_06080 [Mameliella alba]|nr:hypothetical protein [Antarctobacter heliothermus]MBY6143602.1 hypothetical protein [Mameliella alba]MCA0952674.1 hypothetical protein [Mameliella alba]
MFRALTLASFLAAPALADEVWTSDMGDIIYETDTQGAAILSFTNVDGYRAIVVVPGLAGNYDNRSVHDGFWMGEGAGDCLSSMTLGTQSGHQWGQALISFDRPSFPTSFTLTLGDCFGPLAYSIRAEAR